MKNVIDVNSFFTLSLQGTELYQISHKLRNLTSKLTGKSLQSSETKEPQIIKQEIENMFHQLGTYDLILKHLITVFGHNFLICT